MVTFFSAARISTTTSEFSYQCAYVLICSLLIAATSTGIRACIVVVSEVFRIVFRGVHAGGWEGLCTNTWPPPHSSKPCVCVCCLSAFRLPTWVTSALWSSSFPMHWCFMTAPVCRSYFTTCFTHTKRQHISSAKANKHLYIIFEHKKHALTLHLCQILSG